MASDTRPPSNGFRFPATKGEKPFVSWTGWIKRLLPLNDWINGTLRGPAERIIREVTQYELVFDKLELMIALGYAHQVNQSSEEAYWVPVGAFGYRTQNRERIWQELQRSLFSKGDESPFVTSGIFGHSAEQCGQSLDALGKFIAKVTRRWM